MSAPGDRHVVGRIDQQSGLPVDHRIACTADVARDHRQPVKGGLEEHDSEPLPGEPAAGEAAGHREDVGMVEPSVAFGVAEVADEVRLRARRASKGLERAAQRAVAHNHPLSAGNPCGDKRHGASERVVPLVPVSEPAYGDDGRTLFTPAAYSSASEVYTGGTRSVSAAGWRRPPAQDRTCVVTRASSGIGRAIAVALALAGATVCAVARRRNELEVTARRANGNGGFVLYEADLVDDNELERLSKALLTRENGVDVLVHSAGMFSLGDVESASVRDLDRQYAANVRAPYVLTQALLPALRANRGQIVFINSTVDLGSRANVAQYAATKHALKAIADGLREEINPHGVRVVSVYPGRTATPLQATVHQLEGKPYDPDRLIQPEDVASVVITALTLPRSTEVTDLMVRPMQKD